METKRKSISGMLLPALLNVMLTKAEEHPIDSHRLRKNVPTVGKRTKHQADPKKSKARKAAEKSRKINRRK